jgi:hypothetical protein
MHKIFGGSWHTGKQLILLQSTGRTGRLLDHERKAPRFPGITTDHERTGQEDTWSPVSQHLWQTRCAST